MLKVGIVGLPNAGKSTLFNALVTKGKPADSAGKAQTGKHPFTTVDKNIGVVPVPDSTLHDLAKIANIKRATETTISFVDIAGLVKGAHKGEGLGNQFLGHIREVDVILHVVRFFHDDTVAHVHPEIDPEADVEIVNTELMLSDAASLEQQISRLNKSHSDKVSGDTEVQVLIPLAQKVLKGLNDGKSAADLALSPHERALLFHFNVLTDKPVVYVANVDEGNLTRHSERSEESSDSESKRDTSFGLDPSPAQRVQDDNRWISLCAAFEEQLAQLPWTEQRQFLKEYGIKDSALKSVIACCYESLDLLTFYTIAGGRETRAWTLPQGQTVIDAASKVHTDFAKHFIKAEVVPADLLLKLNSWKAAHEAGKVQLVGRDHRVQNRDVIEFKVAHHKSG